MSFLNRKIDAFCARHRNFGIPNLLLYVSIATMLYYIFARFIPVVLIFVPRMVLAQGAIWQIFTFIVTLSFDNVLFMAFTLIFAIHVGQALEHEWGTAKFNFYYFGSMALTVIVGFIVELLPIPGYYYATGEHLFYAIILAYAILYPNSIVNLFGILPLKMKYLGLIDALYIAFCIFEAFHSGNIASAFSLIAPFLLMLVFFWNDLMYHFGRAKHKTSKQTINFKAAQREAQKKKGYLHKCVICGRTDTDNPNLEFRYCSKCNGYFCYCEEHINNHQHKE